MNTPLQQAVQSVTNSLRTFAQRTDFWTSFETAFGKNYDRTKATAIRQSLIDETFTVPIEAVNTVFLGGYIADSNTIQVRNSLLTDGNLLLIEQVVLEGLGQAIDSQINTQSSGNGEGLIFSLLAAGNSINEESLVELRAINPRIHEVTVGLDLSSATKVLALDILASTNSYS
jgi:hypothetical protein